MTFDEALNAYNDFAVVSGVTDRAEQFTLTGIVHNEMHFLPAFLSHYRGLGVGRFVVIDDKSTDGTGDYLAQQPDVVVLNTKRRFGDSISQEHADVLGLPSPRLELVWRGLLPTLYCKEQWSLHLDADEFLDLPKGFSLSALGRLLDAEGVDSVWSVMMDMYPASLSHLRAMETDTVINTDHDWYFDACPHLKLREGQEPRTVYPGSRARLVFKHDLHPKARWHHRKILRPLGFQPLRLNAIRKPIMLRWRKGTRFVSAHSVNLSASQSIVLPLKHYKFHGAISARISRALANGMHYKQGYDYAKLDELFSSMRDGDEDFTCSKSVLYSDFDDFRRTGVSQGL